MRRATISKHLYELFICICVICLLPVFALAADGARLANLAGNAPATVGLTALPPLGWTATRSLITARYYHTASLLPSGNVLVAGGYNGAVLTRSEIYNPSTGAWTGTGSLFTARYHHTATLLPSGLVLVAGGQDPYGDVLSDCEIYDPSTKAWTVTGSLITAREHPTATLLPSGNVLVAGGFNAVALLDSEIYSPSTGAWTATGSLITARYYHTATLLPAGQVLVAGGYNGAVLSDCEIYDPSTGAWTETGSLIIGRYYNTATLLLSGQVLAAGGYNGNVLSDCEIYDSSDTAPGAPTGVTAKPGNAQATVSFTPPVLNGDSAITGYTVTSNPGGITANGLGSPIIVSGLTNGTSYSFTVTATNAIGTSPASMPSNKVTPATVPGAPTGAAATAGNAEATVSFTDPGSNGGYAITGYTVKSNPGGIKAEGRASPITVKRLKNGTDYTFTVTATNKIGTGPPSSPSNSVTPLGAPGAPTGVSATAGNAEATVGFRPPALNGGMAITGFTVTSKPGGITAPGGGSPITVTGLTNGTAYTFTVKATNAIGTGPASSPSNSVTPYTLPGAPLDVTAKARNAEAIVSFKAPASNGGSPIISYTVTSSAGQTAKGHASPITVKDLTNGTSYTFTVTATNKAGTGTASSTSNSVTPSK